MEFGVWDVAGMNSWERKVRRQDGAREEIELRCCSPASCGAARSGAPERRQPVTGSLVALTLLGLPPPPVAAAGCGKPAAGSRVPHEEPPEGGSGSAGLVAAWEEAS